MATQSTFDLDRYDELVRLQHERYPEMVVPPEIAELVQVNTLQLLIKLARYKFAARLIKPTDDVLEVGSGIGWGAFFLAQHCARVTGLEIKEHDHGAAVAMNRRENVVFLLQSLFDYHRPQSHDVVVSLDVLEHFNEQDGHKFVAEIAQLVKDDGMVILGSPSIYSYPHQGPYSQAAHIKCYDQAEKIAMVETYFRRAIPFSMNDEIVHTGHRKMAWYNFAVAFMPRR